MTYFRIVLLSFLTVFQVDAVLAQGSQISAEPNLSDDAIRQRVNAGIVTLITGGVDEASNTYQKLGSDLAAVLDVRSELRVLPVSGYGSIQNIEDLLYLRGIDISMVHSDIMRHLEQKWKEVWKKLDCAAPIKGWQRYEPANVLVEQAAAAQEKPPEPSQQAAEPSQQALANDDVFQQFAEFMRRSYPDHQLGDMDMERLYAHFQLWQQARSPSPSIQFAVRSANKTMEPDMATNGSTRSRLNAE